MTSCQGDISWGMWDLKCTTRPECPFLLSRMPISHVPPSSELINHHHPLPGVNTILFSSVFLLPSSVNSKRLTDEVDSCTNL
ncbi:hypothetical protein CEXT_455841 [Caerostris extrusa]|uniref:Uncharacterized protein n=1 Tax=Caerostris extrusa TaxID=172846 RepID=A0AAV4PZZ7_CAEEX|nr:hypothetical protein CEXT_455841 [Caerostris extrusa]